MSSVDPSPETVTGAGVPDGFGRLWTPHRMAYIKGENKPVGDECPLCNIPGLPDGESLVLRRGRCAYAVLNRYPYNGGHLMVVPYRHVADYAALAGDEVIEIAELTRQSVIALRAASGAAGFNVGLNLGQVAGAGIAAHLHQHVVPRWGGDTNFMPVIGHTKVLAQMLAQTFEALDAVWPDEPTSGWGGETTCPTGP